jgi:uncharacterized SAM-dependent methyltransferase
VTGEFNKNLLARLNRELDANFDIDLFEHHACYNEEEGRIEMYLVSSTHQKVSVGGEDVHFRKGESIHTENSYKYSLQDFKTLVSNWYSVDKVWTDENNYFSLQYLTRK